MLGDVKHVDNDNAKPSYAYDTHSTHAKIRDQALKVMLVGSDCFLIGLQPILVHMSKNSAGKFEYSPISVNFLTELAKCAFAVLLLMYHDSKRRAGERSLLSWSSLNRAARSNLLLMVPALLYAINNYLKFAMQLFFKPATVKMLGNLKVLTIAILLKVIMKRSFSVTQWEALVLLILGITVNQLACSTHPTPEDDRVISWLGYCYTLMSVTIPSAASVYNEQALKSNYETSVHLQNFFTYFYGMVFNLIGLCTLAISNGGHGLSLLSGHNSVTLMLVVNNAAQGILSSFFFKFADTILKKYSSTVATILTGLMSSLLFGHELTVNFFIGVSIVFISMHLFFSHKDPNKAVKASPMSRTDSEITTTMLLERDLPAPHREVRYDLPR